MLAIPVGAVEDMMIGKLLRIEATLALTMAWMLVFLMPLRWLGWLLGPAAAPQDGPSVTEQRTLTRARAVGLRIARVSTRLPWHSTCLVQAVAGALLLMRRGIGGSVVRFGLRKQNGALEAHAWLLLGRVILLGGDEADGYAPVADLSRQTEH